MVRSGGNAGFEVCEAFLDLFGGETGFHDLMLMCCLTTTVLLVNRWSFNLTDYRSLRNAFANGQRSFADACRGGTWSVSLPERPVRWYEWIWRRETTCRSDDPQTVLGRKCLELDTHACNDTAFLGIFRAADD